MKSNFKITGEDELIRKMQSLGADMEKALERGIVQTANQVRNSAIKSIQNQTVGTYVTRYSQGGKAYQHVAAKDGDAPNTDTGGLVRSISVEHTSGNQVAFVGSGLDYAKYLELGTKKMGAKPWLMPALNVNLKNLETNIIKQARAMIEKAAKK